jgi:hypothetical protein
MTRKMSGIGLGVLILVAWLTSAGFGQCTPSPGKFESKLVFELAPFCSAGPYELQRTSTQIIVKKANVVIFTYTAQTGGILRYAFYPKNSDYLVITDIEKPNPIDIRYDVSLVNLAGPSGAVSFSLLTKKQFTTSDQASVSVRPSAGNGDAVFIFTQAGVANPKIDDAQVFCSSTGALLCKAPSFYLSAPPYYEINAVSTATEVKIVYGNTQKNLVPCPFVVNAVVNAFLVLDGSGSMSESAGSGMTKMERLKDAVELFVKLAGAGSGHKLGIIRFDYPTVDLVAPLQAITTSSQQTMIQDVKNLQPGGWTSIGNGLKMAFDKLTTSGIDVASHRVVLLLSDGEENRECFLDKSHGSPECNMPSQPAGERKIEIYTVGLGLAENMDPPLLSTLAFNPVDASKGYFHVTQDNWLELQKYFVSVFCDAFDSFVAQDPVYLVAPGEFVNIPTTVVGSDKGVVFVAHWMDPRSEFLAELLAPDGQKVTPTNAGALGVEYQSGGLFAFYRISFLPGTAWSGAKFGQWTLRITGVEVPPSIDADEVSVSVVVPSDLSFRPKLDRDLHFTGEPILLSAELLERGRPISADEVIVTVTRPEAGVGNILSEPWAVDGSPLDLHPDTIHNARAARLAHLQLRFDGPLVGYSDDVIALYDDGLHGDGLAGDGVWADYYTQTTLEGVYTFRFQASATTHLGEVATREKTVSTAVAVRMIDPEESIVWITRTPLGMMGEGLLYRVSIFPRDSLGNYLGPGYANSISFAISAESVQYVGPVTDNNAGGYSQVFHLPLHVSAGDTHVDVSVFDSSFRLYLGDELRRGSENGGAAGMWVICEGHPSGKAP